MNQGGDQFGVSRCAEWAWDAMLRDTVEVCGRVVQTAGCLPPPHRSSCRAVVFLAGSTGSAPFCVAECVLDAWQSAEGGLCSGLLSVVVHEIALRRTRGVTAGYDGRMMVELTWGSRGFYRS